MLSALPTAFLAGAKHSLFMHGVGAVRSKRAHLFLAQREGGKSTLASFCDEDGVQVLGDEWQLVLETVGGGFFLRPFARQAARPPSAPSVGPATCLGSVFFLEKATRVELVAMRPLRAVARCLHEDLVWTFTVAGPDLRLEVLDRLMRLFRTVPAYVLRFTKDNRFWEVIDEIDQREEAGLART